MSPAELRQRRLALGLSYRRLAPLLGVAQQTVFRWEHDKCPLPTMLDGALRDLEARHVPHAAPVRLTTESAQEIRARRSAGERVPALAAAFGVSARTVYNVLDGRTWREAPPDP